MVDSQVGVVDLPPFVAEKRRHIVGVVGDVAGVVETVASVVGAAADVGEEVIGTDRIYASSAVMAVKLLKPTMNMKPPAMAVKSRMIAILFI